MRDNASVGAAPREPGAPLPSAPACSRCRHWIDDRHALERNIAGLVVFSSGFGASVANSRLCRVHDQLVSPADSCRRFGARH